MAGHNARGPRPETIVVFGMDVLVLRAQVTLEGPPGKRTAMAA